VGRCAEGVAEVLMFKWFEYANPKGVIRRIIDDDFVYDLVPYWDNVFVELIKVYEAKCLPVVPNLLLAMKYHSRIHDGYPITQMIRGIKENKSNAYGPYADELNKYLTLA
jgi:hypothetical protein